MSVTNVSATIDGDTYELEKQEDFYSESIVAPRETSSIVVEATDEFGNESVKSDVVYVNTYWISPKTNWKPTDFINLEDYNRITGNFEYLHQLAKKMRKDFDIIPMDFEVNFNAIPYARTFNTYEQNLETINDNSYSFDIGQSKEYYPNSPTIDFNELNRIESAMLLIYNTLIAEKTAMNRLSFRLGGMKGIK